MSWRNYAALSAIALLLSYSVGFCDPASLVVVRDTEVQIKGKVLSRNQYGLLVSVRELWYPDADGRSDHSVDVRREDWPHSFDIVLLGGAPDADQLADGTEVNCVAKYQYLYDYQTVAGNIARVRYLVFVGPPRLGLRRFR